MTRQPNRIAGDLARVERAVPLADQHPSGCQPVKELAFRPCSGHRTADVPTERYPGRLVPAAPRGLLRLGPARPLGGGAIRRRRGPQPEPFLRCPARLADPVEVVPDSWPGAILAGQGRHDVNVIVIMANCHPSDSGLVSSRGEAGAVHDLGCDVCPFGVGHDPVPRRGANRAVPHGLVVARPSQGGQRLCQQPGQTTQIR